MNCSYCNKQLSPEEEIYFEKYVHEMPLCPQCGELHAIL